MSHTEGSSTLIGVEELARLRAAEEVCWSLLIAIAVGQAEIPIPLREYIADHGLQQWAELSVKTGTLRKEGHGEHHGEQDQAAGDPDPQPG